MYKFLETNGMSHILRAHQLCMEGFSSLFDNHLSTVWSAPNYCYRCGNQAAIMEIDEKLSYSLYALLCGLVSVLKYVNALS